MNQSITRSLIRAIIAIAPLKMLLRHAGLSFDFDFDSFGPCSWSPTTVLAVIIEYSTTYYYLVLYYYVLKYRRNSTATADTNRGCDLARPLVR
jgi:hypothetical protein